MEQPQTISDRGIEFEGSLRRDRWVYAAAGCLLLVYLCLTWYLRLPAVTTGNDDATYLHLARALSRLSYQELWVVGAPVHSHYPPVYPALLAVAGFFSGYRLDALLLMNHAFVLLALWLMFDAVRRLWSPTLALLMLAALVVNPSLVHFGGRLMSEAPYLALSCLALWIPTRFEPAQRWAAVALGAAAILAALTRSVGIALLAGVFAYWALRRRWLALGSFSLAAVVFVGSWFVWTALAPHEVFGARSYVADAAAGSAGQGLLLTLWERVSTTVPRYVTRIIPWELPLPVTPSTVADNVLWVTVVVGLGGLGLASAWRRWRILALYLGAYGGLLSLWTWVVGRFLTPIIPLIILVLLVGTDVIRRRWSARAGTALAVALTCVVALTGMRADWTEIQSMRGCDRSAPLESPGCFDPDQRSLFAASRFVAANTPDSAVVLTAKDATFALYSGRKVIRSRALLATEPDAFFESLAESGADYVFLGSTAAIEGTVSRPLWLGCTRLDLVASFPPRSYLFRPAQTTSDTASAACRALADYRRQLDPRLLGDDSQR